MAQQGDTQEVEGVVARVQERQVTTQRGPATAYSIALNRGGSSDEWFGFKFKNPNLSQGQQVKFTAEARTFTNREGQEVVSWDAVPGTVQVARTTGTTAPKTNVAAAAKNVDNRQRSIVLQSAYERAILLINGALENEAIKLPAKVALKFDTYKMLVRDTAMELAELFIDPPEQFVSDEDVVSAGDVTVTEAEADSIDDGYEPVV